jgi:hypothetical protein
MTSLLRKSFGLGAVLALLAGPALAQPYYNGGQYRAPGYGAPYYDGGWQRERQEAMWRAHERREAWWHATHDYGYGCHHDDDSGRYYRSGD